MKRWPHRTLLLLGCLVLRWPQAACADFQLGERTQLVFASAAAARAELLVRDEFVQRLSPFDRSARLKTDQPVDEATYLAFASKQALEWSDDEQARVSAALEALKERLLALNVNFPERIQLIKTTGLEEGAAAYTRGSSIILPRNMLGGGQGQLESLLCHELFHVLSRHDAALRDRLYRSIGFQRCAELQLPDELSRRRLTNPDGPIDNYCIKVTVTGDQRAAIAATGQEQWAIPILTATSETYDAAKGGEFFEYLTFKLILIQRAAAPSASGQDAPRSTQPLLIDGKPVLISPQEAGGFMDQIGRNTGYIIHPDEVLADNFVMIVLDRTDVPSPEVLARIRAALSGKR